MSDDAPDNDAAIPPQSLTFSLPPAIAEHYIELNVLPDGRIIGVARLLFHYTLHIDIDEIGYADRYCYATLAPALAALHEWKGVGDPEGWHRHIKTNRRRDLATGREWIAP